MHKSFEEASERLGITPDELLTQIIDGKLTVVEIAAPQRYRWFNVEECADQRGLSLLEPEEEDGDWLGTFRELVLLEALRLASERVEVLTRQIEAKDHQLEMNTRQLHGHAQEIDRLHQLLFAYQDMVSSSNTGRHPWWKRLLGTSTPESSATA